jgi:transposase InsO family protein
MVAAYRGCTSLRQVAKDFNETKSTVQRWVAHAKGKRLDRVDFYDKPSGSRQPPNKSPNKLEKRVLQLRKHLQEKSVLGLHGSEAIRDEMNRRGDSDIPAIRTIDNILKRNGMVDKRTRIRRPAPPPGWYLPDLMRQKVELDSFDILEGLYLHGGQEVQLLNGLSLHGNLLHSVANDTQTSENTVLALIEHWRQFGLPKYVQFDNDMVFQGPRMENVVGKVIRLCLSLKVTPIFTTPYEQGFQGKIERFNGEIQAKFWQRRQFKNIKDVEKHLERYVKAHRFANQEKILLAPRRRSFPKRWKRDDTKQPSGTIIYLRRTDGSGRVRFLEREFLVSKHWVNRLVRVEVNLEEGKVQFFALRRADWKKQRLLKTRQFRLSKKTTSE